MANNPISNLSTKTGDSEPDPPSVRKTPRDRFLQVAPKRVEAVLQKIRLLARCGNPVTYKYTEAEVAKIFDAIESEMTRARAQFRGKKKAAEFSFDE